MNEIEKLYENAGIEKKIMCDWTCNYGDKFSDNCNVHCLHYEDNDLYYPPFTAEKQLSIMKFIIKKGYYYDTKETDFNGEKYCFCVDSIPFKRVWNTFEEAIAKYINDIWQNLTDEEKEQIREILKDV